MQTTNQKALTKTFKITSSLVIFLNLFHMFSLKLGLDIYLGDVLQLISLNFL